MVLPVPSQSTCATRISTFRRRARGVTDVICTIGFTPSFVAEEDRRAAEEIDYLATVRLIHACEAVALPGRFVLVSSLGVGASSQSARLLDATLGRVLERKGQAEAALRRSTLDWTIVRPGLLQQDKAFGGVLLGPAARWIGGETDDVGLGSSVKCASPFLASSGAVCATTRRQVADVCVESLRGGEAWTRRTVEMVSRPEVPLGTMRWADALL